MAGCGDRKIATYPAGGIVTFPDGKPLVRGLVSFRPLDGNAKLPSARGQIQPDGTFELATFKPGDGAVEGRHQAAVVIPPGLSREAFKEKVPVSINPRFNDLEKSNLTFDVTTDPANNRFKIVVTK